MTDFYIDDEDSIQDLVPVGIMEMYLDWLYLEQGSMMAAFDDCYCFNQYSELGCAGCDLDEGTCEWAGYYQEDDPERAARV